MSKLEPVFMKHYPPNNSLEIIPNLQRAITPEKMTGFVQKFIR